MTARHIARGHIDLFSGIGGFSLAAQANGIETEVFCEADKRCREFLQRTYPDAPVLPDIREFDGAKWRGRYLLTAGVPCQPASRAGKQGGKNDDRWLWPEALRVIDEAKPAWCLLENPPGIGDVGLSGILADLEGQGYEVRVVGIPACAVGSPQIRNRYWILAHCNGSGWQRGIELGKQEERREAPPGCGHDLTRSSQINVAHTTEQGHQGAGSERREEAGQQLSTESGQSHLADTKTGIIRPGLCETEQREIRGRRSCHEHGWNNYVWVPCADGKVRRAPDDSFSLVDGLHRSVLGALGNSICWPVAAEIIKAIVEADS